MALAGAFTAFILYMRPVLKRMESAALATETASKAMEQSAKEFEQTSLLLQADSPSMIAEIEAAAQEYHQLGQTLNIMTAGFRGKNPVKDWSALSMKRVAKDVSALTNALSPAMDQWRKRISRIATSFEVANKAELKTAEKQVLDSKAKQGSAIGGAEEPADGPLQAVQDTGKQLASAAVSLRQGLGGGNSTGGNSTGGNSIGGNNCGGNSTDAKSGRRATRDDAVSTQKALDLLDANEAQTGADAINAAAEAAEKVATQVTQLVADLAQGSNDSDAVADAYQQSVSSQDLPGMSEEEQALLTQLATKKKAAEQVYRALQRAEQAATAAATASGALEQAMQVAESQGVLSSSDEIHVSNSSSIRYRRQDDKTVKAKNQGKRRQESLLQAKQGVEAGISAVQVDSSSRDSPAGPNPI